MILSSWPADGAHLVDAAAHLLGELVHLHDARPRRRPASAARSARCRAWRPAVWSARRRISRATTRKPRPYSPAFSASMAALTESRFVWSATFVIVVTTPVMSRAFSLMVESRCEIEPAARARARPSSPRISVRRVAAARPRGSRSPSPPGRASSMVVVSSVPVARDLLRGRGDLRRARAERADGGLLLVARGGHLRWPSSAAGWCDFFTARTSPAIFSRNWLIQWASSPTSSFVVIREARREVGVLLGHDAHPLGDLPQGGQHRAQDQEGRQHHHAQEHQAHHDRLRAARTPRPRPPRARGAPPAPGPPPRPSGSPRGGRRTERPAAPRAAARPPRGSPPGSHGPRAGAGLLLDDLEEARGALVRALVQRPGRAPATPPRPAGAPASRRAAARRAHEPSGTPATAARAPPHPSPRPSGAPAGTAPRCTSAAAGCRR